jgi:hypothetical protein
MGSWYGTCMLTNLPIIDGERVKLVFLKSGIKNGISTSSFCYSTGLMTPAFLAISGEYNDYGRIGNIDKDWNYMFIEKMLKQRYKEILLEKEPKEEFTLEDIMYAVERGNEWGWFKTKKRGNMFEKETHEFETDDLCYVMIREDAWDKIVAQYQGQFRNPSEEEIANGNYYVGAKEWAKSSFDAYINDARAIAKFNEEPMTKDNMTLYSELSFNLSQSNIFLSNREWLKLELGKFEYHTLLQKNEIAEAQFFKQWQEHVIICDFMENTRKSWMVQSGGGSQDQDWESYKMLNKIVDEICDTHLEKIDY